MNGLTQSWFRSVCMDVVGQVSEVFDIATPALTVLAACWVSGELRSRTGGTIVVLRTVRENVFW